MNKTTNHLGGITAALLLTAGLVGCASRTSTSSPTTTTVTSTTSTTVSQSIKVDALVAVVQERLGGGSRSQAIDIAKQACTVIDTAGSVSAAISSIATDPDISYETGSDMVFIMGAAIRVYCPEYSAQADRISGD